MLRIGSLTGSQLVASGLIAVFTLSACNLSPLRPLPPRVESPVAVVPPPSGEMPEIETEGLPADLSASGAERACIAAGRERGLDVVGVVGSSTITGSNGEAARDVMLRVRRGGAEIEVRCNYVAETRMARIMLI
ncbi:MAG: hypothetical protein EA407_01365 [Rhodobacteraceae bacterium]|nr:MAG: hypothetical protein EA407_01365 [Paracoccaceae bacterium]